MTADHAARVRARRQSDTLRGHGIGSNPAAEGLWIAVDEAGKILDRLKQLDEAEEEIARLRTRCQENDLSYKGMFLRAEHAETLLARVRADCEAQTAKPLRDDLGRGIYAQARRTLNILQPGGEGFGEGAPVRPCNGPESHETPSPGNG